MRKGSRNHIENKRKIWKKLHFKRNGLEEGARTIESSKKVGGHKEMSNCYAKNN